MPAIPNRVLIHRGRVVRKVATGARVEGTREYGTVYGPWFRCRVFPEESQEGEGVRGGRKQLMKTPHVIVGIKDLQGDPVAVGEITPAVQLEIDAGPLGTSVWQVGSDPQPLLAPTKPIGFYFGVRRVEVAGAVNP